MSEATTPTRRNVVLTGFMGTGKTTVGRLLAARLGYRFVDTDEVIAGRHGPIAQIFAEHGEETFRRLERSVAAELAEASGLVVATGGRMMLDTVNAERLEETGDVFCLVASVDTIVDRVSGGGAADRPLLAAGDGDVRALVAELLAEREEGYGRFRQIDTEDRAPDEVVAAIESVRSNA